MFAAIGKGDVMTYMRPVVLGHEHGVVFATDYYLPEIMRETLKNNPSQVVLINKSFYYRNSIDIYDWSEAGAVICTPLHAALFAKD